jgi:hypothetical protein
VLEGHGGRKVRVVESIASEWEEVAKALDMGQEDIDMIKTRHSDHDEEACREMLATWLEGNNSEVSWTALTQALIDAGLPELAYNLKDAVTVEFSKCEDKSPKIIGSSELTGPLQAKEGTCIHSFSVSFNNLGSLLRYIKDCDHAHACNKLWAWSMSVV